MDAALDDAGPGRLTTPADLLRVEVTVPLGTAAAFARFVDDMDGWWPADSALRSIDAAVTLWEPPTRIGATWSPGSTVDVRFAEVDDDLTTVIVEHRHLDRHDPGTRATITGEAGWWQVLRAYAAASRGTGTP